MEWIKHYTGSHDDPDISDAMDEFGHIGYTVFFIVLEIYGQEFNHLDSDGWLTVSKKFMERKLRIPWLKRGKTLEECWSSRGVDRGKLRSYCGVVLEFFRSRGRFEIIETPEMVSIRIQKFIDISSNWTKRKISLPTEALQRPSVGPTAIEEEEEEEEEKKKKNKPPKPPRGYTDDFESFWKEYPKRIGKGDAFKSWDKNSRPDIEIILKAVREQKESDQWKKDGGQFIPLPSTWLNQKRWDDEPFKTRSYWDE